MYLKNSIRNFQKVVSNGDKRCGTLKDDVGTVKDGCVTMMGKAS